MGAIAPTAMPLTGKSQPIKRDYLRLRSFSKGMNAAAAVAEIPPGQAALLQDWYLSEDGSLLLRRGTLLWNAASLGTGTISATYRAYLNGTAMWLAVFNGTLYQGTDSTKTWASQTIPTGATLTSGKPTWFTQYLTFAYLATTADTPIKSSNGTTWTLMGVASGGAAATVAATTGGSMATGSYTFEYTYQSATVEGNPSAVSSTATLTGTQNAVSLTGIVTSANTAVTGINIYGSQTGVSSTYQLIGTIAASTTTYTVTSAQTSWGAAPPTTHNMPVVGPYLFRAWKSRMWSSGDPNNTARVYFSDIFIPESWPAANYFDVPFEAGDKIIAIFPLGDILFVFGNFSIFYVIGDTPFSFVVKQSFAQGGVQSPYAVDRIQNTLVFLSNFSIKAFDGSTERVLSGSIDPYFNGILTQTPALNQGSGNVSTLRYYDQLNALVVSFPTGSSTTNNTSFWYFVKTEGWVLDTRNIAMFWIDNAPGGTGNLFAWDSAAGIMRQWDVPNTFTDDGTAITAKITTGLLIPGENSSRWMWLRTFATPSNNTATITGLVDGGAQSDTISLNFASHGGGIYGTGVYGTDKYAAAFDTFDERWNDSMVGRTMQLQYSMTSSTFVRVISMTQETMPLPRPRWFGTNA